MDTKELENNLKIVAEYFNSEISAIRTNRPSPRMVEDIQVDVYEQKTPIKQLGSISIVPPREIVITLWDANAVAPTAKGLEIGNYGFNPQIRGHSIHLNLPPLSQERREELKKLAGSIAEKARIQIRSHRDHANKTIVKEDGSEDEKERTKKQVQEMIDKANKEIEESLAKKEAELSE
ncbi:MAG: ribosome-recycling factor [bacterium]|nr:ribosome-recycling factor [bacterium]